MFTGIVEATGRLRRISGTQASFRAAITARLRGRELELGESIAVNGVCLTVAAITGAGFEADVSVETTLRTTLGALAPDAEVNLERAAALGDRLGGHLVSGHVDGLARVVRTERADEGLLVELCAPDELARYIAEKGSVALDGVSLTVNRVAGANFELMLIPHTLAVTTLKHMATGSEHNLEVDLLARYVARFLEATSKETRP
jgi:riboflavin synthase